MLSANAFKLFEMLSANAFKLFEMLSENAFKLDWSQILLFDKELTVYPTMPHLMH